MYPSEAFGEFYGESDLPQELVLNSGIVTTGGTIVAPITLTKYGGTSPAYVSEYFATPNGATIGRIEIGGSYSTDAQGFMTAWLEMGNATPYWNIAYSVPDNPLPNTYRPTSFSPCLLGEGAFWADDVTDNFSDSYLVEIDGFGGDSEEVQRVSLCDWSSSERPSVGFEYRGRASDVGEDYYCKWTASFSEAANAIKQGTQDSPVGTYGPVDWFGIEATITVSEL